MLAPPRATATIGAMAVPSTFSVQLSVSIVLHDSCLSLLHRTLSSLSVAAGQAQDSGLLRGLTVTLVDNASGATYREQLAALVDEWPSDGLRLQCEWQSTNRGFGRGHNVVIRELDSDYHLVLNPDVELQPDTLQAGLSVLQSHSDIILVSPWAAGSNGEQEFLCKGYPSALALLLRGFAPPAVSRLFRRRLDAYELRDRCSGDAQVEVLIASGCFMLARTAELRAVGGFNEHFFLYFEDFDLSLRLQNKGRLVFDPAVRIVHHGGYAAAKGWRHLRYFVASGIRFFNHHGWRWI
ncbi:glycosyltransferase family 2 protein [Halioglobus sp.]|nr:glycosyltransferase family 2 protein [Halioglobus sp.]